MLLLNRLFSNEPFIWIFSILTVCSIIFIYTYYKYRRFSFSAKRIWRFFCTIPFFLSLIHFCFFRFQNHFWLTKYYYGLFYLSSIILLFLPLVEYFKITRKLFFKLIGVFAILANLHTVFMPQVWSSALRNHSKQSYTKAFISTTKDLEKYYSLKDWKKIDIPELREKFLPVIQEAENTQDAGLMDAALIAFSHYFYDGHVYVDIDDYYGWKRALELLAGNDYGFSMITLDDGNTVAINVSEKSFAYRMGIHNGTIMTSWNGLSIKDALERTDFIYPGSQFPVKTTEDFLKPIMLATKGMHENGEWGIVADLLETAKVQSEAERSMAIAGFINDQGEQIELMIPAIGSGINRMEKTAFSLFYSDFQFQPDLENLHSVMIDQDTAYMRRNSERNNNIYDIISYFTNKLPSERKRLINELSLLKENGMKKLLIDARGNNGGFWVYGAELASLFTKEAFDVGYRGSELFGKTRYLNKISVDADGRFSDIEVVLLTDNYCMSAGDCLVKILSECPNVTVMGITPSNGCCQETGGVSYLTDSKFRIFYPVNWLYETDGRRFIDTDETRECTIPLDVKIPVTLETLQKIYSNNEASDFILDYALDYLKSK